MANPDIQQALALLRRRDRSAVERAIALLQKTAFSFSMRMCGHREDAEDTAQDVLIRAMPYLANFDSPQALSVWLYKTARNRCVSSRRRSRFAPGDSQRLSLDELMPDGRELQDLLAGPEPTPETRVLHEETRRRLRDSLLKLAPQYRLVLVLHDMEGLETEEIGRILNLREGTVRVRLHRARLFLRRELARPAAKRSKSSGASSPRGNRCRSLFAALSDYLDGLVDDATCAAMQTHISDCAPCQAFLDSLQRTVEQCRAYAPECRPERSAAIRQQLVRQYLDALEALNSRPKRKAAQIGSSSR